MQHDISIEDREFLRQFASGEIKPSEFHHREHIRLAYILLVTGNLDEATARMRDMLFAFIHRNGVDPVKYHETMTQAWVRAVLHFMQGAATYESASRFIACNGQLLNQQIILSHYSRELLYSAEARRHFVEPDLQPIPLRVAA
jgi:hypothetical protein